MTKKKDQPIDWTFPTRRWTDEEVAEYKTKHRNARHLRSQEKEDAIGWIARGNFLKYLAKHLGTNNRSVYLTLHTDLEWAKQLHDMRNRRIEEVETELIRGAFGRHKAIKKTYIAIQAGRNEYALDENGNPILKLVRKEITKSPPDMMALKFWLQANDERYQTKKQPEGSNLDYTSPEDLKARMVELMKEKGIAEPDNDRSRTRKKRSKE